MFVRGEPYLCQEGLPRTIFLYVIQRAFTLHIKFISIPPFAPFVSLREIYCLCTYVDVISVVPWLFNSSFLAAFASRVFF